MWADLDKLRIERPALHRLVAQQTGFMTGIRVVDVRDYSAEVGRGIQEWERGNERQPESESEFNKRLTAFKKHQATPDIAAQVTPVEKPVEPQVTIDFEQTLREEAADLQKRADEGAARNRLGQYAEQGLEDTQRNADLIKQWLVENVKGYVSAAGVDAAVANLGLKGTNQLTWKLKEAPAPPPAAEPAEVLADWQLPIDADERAMKHADVRAVKDLLSRRRAQMSKYRRPSGSFGSSF